MKIGKPIPKYGFFLQPRQTGKTTRAVKEFLQRENCLFLTPNERMRRYIIRNFNIPRQYHEDIKIITGSISQFMSKRWDSLIIDDIQNEYISEGKLYYLLPALRNKSKIIAFGSDINNYKLIKEYFPIKLIENHLDN